VCVFAQLVSTDAATGTTVIELEYNGRVKNLTLKAGDYIEIEACGGKGGNGGTGGNGGNVRVWVYCLRVRLL
jgi:hypothetical protein